MRKDRRRTAYRYGLWAETLAAFWLRAKGFRPLGRRVRIGGGELDLIMRRGGLVIFVEVKYRPDPDSAAQAIGASQQARQRRAADVWLSGRRDLQDCALRFDAVFVSPWRLPRHLAGAFEG
ncbi:MAG: YraN family protein [Alphaproteobacteria bacterium]